jgi:hypothetical protein
MVPHSKGTHQTLDIWRPNRDEDGWKLPTKDITRKRRKWALGQERAEPPSRVRVAPWLKEDLEALEMLVSAERPPKRRVKSFMGLVTPLGWVTLLTSKESLTSG